jgi:hypothetical protein
MYDNIALVYKNEFYLYVSENHLKTETLYYKTNKSLEFN